jgi:hypothetical protein
MALMAITVGLAEPSAAQTGPAPRAPVDPAAAAVGPSADELARQELMFSVFDPFYVELLKSPDADGYAYAVASDGIRSMTLYWRGPVPQRVHEFAANDVFPVEVRASRYSETDLGQLARSINARWDPRWGTYLGLNPATDMNDFAVSWLPRLGVDAPGVAGALERSVPGIGDVRLEVAPPLIRTAGWRWNGSSPWNSGAGLATGDGSAGNTVCTLGPAALVNGSERFLTAGHCGTHTYVDGTGQTIGPTTFVSTLHDYQFIQASASGKVFVSTWDNFDGPTRDISALGGNMEGTFVCNEGANSGEHCLLDVRDSFLDDNGWRLWIAAHRFDPTEVVNVGGDSGAPIITRTNVEATVRGLNIGFFTALSCSGVPMRAPATNCGAETIYHSLTQILDHHDATLITS